MSARASVQLSIIIPVHNEAHRLKETVLSLQATADLACEIVVVDDASTDGCADFPELESFENVRLFRSSKPLGVAGARNFGLNQSRAPVVMFLDGHCHLSTGCLSSMFTALLRLGRGIVVPQVVCQGDPTARGFGMTLDGPNLAPVWLSQQFNEPYPVPVGGGCGQMFFRSWFEQIGRYDKMRTYGVEDLEISIRSWLMGGPVQLVPKAVVEHYFRSKTTCHVTWSDVVYNSLRMAHLHFSGRRLEAVVDYWTSNAAYPEAEQWLHDSDLLERRAWLEQRRRHSGDWFCDKFSILP